MEKCIADMENNIDCICLNTLALPQLCDCDILTASENFFHMDRTADFNVMIYVTDGAMYVTENGQDYDIAPGELLFLRSGLRHFGKREILRGTRWFYAHFYLCENAPDEAGRLVLPKKISGLEGSVHEEKMLELCSYFHSQDSLKAFRQNAKLYELLVGIGAERIPQRESAADRICAYLDSQADTPFTKALVEKKF